MFSFVFMLFIMKYILISIFEISPGGAEKQIHQKRICQQKINNGGISGH